MNKVSLGESGDGSPPFKGEVLEAGCWTLETGKDAGNWRLDNFKLLASSFNSSFEFLASSFRRINREIKLAS